MADRALAYYETDMIRKRGRRNMADWALVYYEICFESAAEEIWPTEHWYTMRYALKAWLKKYGRQSIGIL